MYAELARVVADARDRICPPSSYMGTTSRGVRLFAAGHDSAVVRDALHGTGAFTAVDESDGASFSAWLEQPPAASVARPVVVVLAEFAESQARRALQLAPLCAWLAPADFDAAAVAGALAGEASVVTEAVPVSGGVVVLAGIRTAPAAGVGAAARALQIHGVPTAASDGQFAFTRLDRDLWLRVVQSIRSASVLWGCVRAQDALVALVERLVADGRRDSEIYAELHRVLHTDIAGTDEYQRAHRPTAEATQSSFRSNMRVDEIVKLLPVRTTRIGAMLDLGCAEGSITEAVGRAYGVDSANIHGCDVREPANTSGFSFHLYDGQHLPFAEGQFDLVTALMTLHHVEHTAAVVAEIFRVLRPGGFLVLREHDCSPPELASFLDIVHGCYSLVWSQPQEWPAFTREYYSEYRSRSAWTRMLCDAGFHRIEDSPDVKHLYEMCNSAAEKTARRGGHAATPYGGRSHGSARGAHHKMTNAGPGRLAGANLLSADASAPGSTPLSPASSAGDQGAPRIKNPQRFWYGLYRKPRTP